MRLQRPRTTIPVCIYRNEPRLTDDFVCTYVYGVSTCNVFVPIRGLSCVWSIGPLLYYINHDIRRIVRVKRERVFSFHSRLFFFSCQLRYNIIWLRGRGHAKRSNNTIRADTVDIRLRWSFFIFIYIIMRAHTSDDTADRSITHVHI